MFKYAEYIYEIYKEKSFTKAAKNLFISQPALSSTVRKIEEEMHIDIFDRSASPLKLTPEGEAYIRAIEEIFKVREDFENHLINVAKLNVGNISVSGANFISSYVLPKIISSFLEKYPLINVNLYESNSTTLIEELVNEKIDILLDYNTMDDIIDSYKLFEETILLCVPKHLTENSIHFAQSLSAEDIKKDIHLSPTTKSINLNDFSDSKFLMLKSGNSMNKHGFKMCKESGFNPDVLIYFDQLMTSYNMAASGLGICFVPDTLVKNVSSNENLLYYKINSPNAKRTLYLMRKKKRYLNRAVEAFIETAREVYINQI